MKAQFTIVLALFCLFTAPFHAQEVEFNYEGRVSVDGLPYTGQGYFKFAIVNLDASITYWSNDGTSAAGSEPAAAVVTAVTDGVFNVIIGDVSQANMNPLEASIFNGYEQVFLRVWFSDGVLGFEHLAPDRRITNPALLGLLSFDEIHVYVNPDTGNDAYSGLSPGRPKQTIQAAWDALPPMIRENATIHLADGIYREEALLTGKSVIGNATITIQGNELNPTQVRITGSDATADTTPVRNTCFRVDRQENLAFRGLLIDYTKDWDQVSIRREAGIFVSLNSDVLVRNCTFENNSVGILVENSSQISTNDCSFDNGLGSLPYGVYIRRGSGGIFQNSSFLNQNSGVLCDRFSWARFLGCTVDNCTIGINTTFSASSEFAAGFTLSRITNCSKGVRGAYNAILIQANTHVSYGTGPDANGTDIEAINGTQTWN